MPSSSTVSAGDTATATQYNNLRTDAIQPRTVWSTWSYTTGNDSLKEDFSAATINNTGTPEIALINLCVPDDFDSISEAVIVVIPAANTNTSWDLDIEVTYATADEADTTHTDSDTGTAYDYSTDDNKIKEIDISGLLGSIAAGDYLGVKIENNETDQLYVLGVRFEYNI